MRPTTECSDLAALVPLAPPLVHRRLCDRDECEHAVPSAVHPHASEPTVDDHIDTGERQRRLRDIGGEVDLALARGLERFGERPRLEPAVHGDDVTLHPLQRVRTPTDL